MLATGTRRARSRRPAHLPDPGRTGPDRGGCPSGPIDDRDPVPWALVSDEGPIGPGLPRLRYRLPVPPGSQEQVTAAVRRYAPPHLWLGEAQREPGHLGRPDPSRRPGR